VRTKIVSVHVYTVFLNELICPSHVTLRTQVKCAMSSSHSESINLQILCVIFLLFLLITFGIGRSFVWLGRRLTTLFLCKRRLPTFLKQFRIIVRVDNHVGDFWLIFGIEIIMPGACSGWSIAITCEAVKNARIKCATLSANGGHEPLHEDDEPWRVCPREQGRLGSSISFDKKISTCFSIAQLEQTGKGNVVLSFVGYPKSMSKNKTRSGALESALTSRFCERSEALSISHREQQQHQRAHVISLFKAFFG
jgi:hypothetical protein